MFLRINRTWATSLHDRIRSPVYFSLGGIAAAFGLDGEFPADMGEIGSMLQGLVAGTASAIAPVLPLLLPLILTLAVAITLAIGLAEAGNEIGVLVLVLAGAMTIGLAGTFAFSMAESNNPIIITAFLFVAVFPLANALLDWASGAVSRRVARLTEGPVEQRYTFLTVSGLALADLCLALIFLVGLAATIPLTIGLFNAIIVKCGGAPIEIARFIALAKSDPWGEGLWVTLMLLSTLVPSVWRFFIATARALISTEQIWKPRSLLWADQPDDNSTYRVAFQRPMPIAAGAPLRATVFLGLGIGMTFIAGLASGNNRILPHFLADVADFSLRVFQ